MLGTPLNTIYPAENRSLAECILTASGLLLSELPLGSPGFRRAFVQRDRIQSGLSLAVLPVQSTLEGGTMHTVGFARAQGRLIACPSPVKNEAQARQYEAIRSLIQEEGRSTYVFKASLVHESELLQRLLEQRERMLPHWRQIENEQRLRQARAGQEGLDPSSSLSPEQDALQQAWEVALKEPDKSKQTGETPSKRRIRAPRPSKDTQPLFSTALPLSQRPVPAPSPPSSDSPLSAEPTLLWEP